MNGKIFTIAPLVCSLVLPAVAQTRYVSLQGAHVSPFLTWANAATNLQSAVDVCAGGETVLVSNGVYRAGGRAIAGSLTNRVAVDRPIRLESLNGPEVTAIEGAAGAGGGNGNGAVRCVYLTNGAVLCGFTLTNGHTRAAGDLNSERTAGGVFAAGAVLSNCVLVGNAADYQGGAVFSGALFRCEIRGNTAGLYGGGAARSSLQNCRVNGNAVSNWHGGGVAFCAVRNSSLAGNHAKRGAGSYGSTLYGCTLTGNRASVEGGGSYQDSLVNCIVQHNRADIADPNVLQSFAAIRCCATPAPPGNGNFGLDPLLTSLREPRLLPGSPCVDAGENAYASGTDLDGEPRIAGADAAVDIGCDEWPDAAPAGPPSVAIHAPWSRGVKGVFLPFEADVRGAAGGFAWNFGDGTAASNAVSVSHAFTSAGTFDVILTATNGTFAAAATARVTIVEQQVHYVSTAGGHVAPYTNWAAAARDIQSAVDAAPADLYGAEVWVSNGVYNTGYRAGFGLLYARVVIDKPVRVRSVAGPAATVIAGYADPSGSDGYGAARCVTMGENSALSGFTLMGGHTFSNADFGAMRNYFSRECNGGGVWCASAACLVSNCVFTGNTAALQGGAAYRGTLVDCVLATNRAKYGGGAYGATLINCVVSSNTAADAWNDDDGWGGGLYSCSARGCLVSRNAAAAGAGARNSLLRDCTVTANTADFAGGGVFLCRSVGSIVYDNVSTLVASNQNYYEVCSFDHCCVTPPAEGPGNVAAPPRFLAPSAGDFRLPYDSPCVDAGLNAPDAGARRDLAGTPRPFNGVADMGAYEFGARTRIRAFLQGAYSAGMHGMNTTLAAAGRLPSISPFCDDPATVSSFPTGVVDWVLVQLLDTNGVPVSSRSALLRSDGWAVAADGRTDLFLDVAPGGLYRAAVRHRNHAAAAWATTVPFTNEWTEFDFTVGSDRFLGGVSACVESEPGAFALAAGDVDADGMVTTADVWLAAAAANVAGYVPADASLDGTANAADTALCAANVGIVSRVSAGGGRICPEATVWPDQSTVAPGEEVTLAAAGAAGPVRWYFVRNESGATLVTNRTGTTVVYRAGSVTSAVDIVGAWDSGGGFGRFRGNVVGAQDTGGSGLAIIVAGRSGAHDPLWPTTSYLTDSAYAMLRYRGFPKANILYLSPVTGRDVDGDQFDDDIDLATTPANVAAAFTNWARGAARLFVCMVDHGADADGAGSFLLDRGEALSASLLDTWLDALQNAYATDVTVLMDCCHAGSLLDEMTFPTGGPARVVIASASSNAPAFFVAGGAVSFSGSFLNGLLLGHSVTRSYRDASEAMESYQEPVYWDTGDGRLGEELRVGPAFVAGAGLPNIGLVCGPQGLSGGTRAVLWADDVVSEQPIRRVWCAVLPPDQPARDPSRPVDRLAEVDLTYDEATGRYQADYDGFATRGTYKIVYYARDSGNRTSLPRQSHVLQNAFEERAILVAGPGSTAARTQDILTMAQQAYRVLLARQIAPSHIRYLSSTNWHDANGDGTNDVAGLCSEANVLFAVTNWACGGGTGGPAAKLDLCMAGDSVSKRFRTAAGTGLNVTGLRTAVSTFQGATNRPAVVAVLDFPECGVTAAQLKLSGRNGSLRRVVASAAREGQDSVRQNHGAVGFWGLFWQQVFVGRSVGAAFAAAREGVGEIRRNQHPDLEAAEEEEEEDENDDRKDGHDRGGSPADRTFIGNAFLTGAGSPGIGRPMWTVYTLSATATVWAADAADLDGVSSLWCAIAPPDSESPAFETNLAWNVSANRYECAYGGFAATGVYTVMFLATDAAGDVSPPAFARVVRLALPAEADADGDGVPNGAEAAAGTDPADSNSVFRFGAIVRTDDGRGYSVVWRSASNRRYTVQWCTNLAAGVWLPAGADVEGDGRAEVFTDRARREERRVFYRIRAE